MLVARNIIVEIHWLKTQLAKTFDMKDLGEAKKILGMEIQRDRKNGKFWLSQQKYVEKILMRFNMNNVKTIQIPLDSHFNLSSGLCPSNDKEKYYISRVPCANVVGSVRKTGPQSSKIKQMWKQNTEDTQYKRDTDFRGSPSVGYVH
jgi:ATP-binding cassette subfamily B (MDR/TAP) protein 1